MTARPKISVILPAFDATDTLSEQLAALAHQAPPFAWELLVCDNGSRDGTADLARSWTGRIPNLRVLDASARRGPSFARNLGGAAALAPLLAFCDADDVVADDWVERMATALAVDSIVAGSLETTRLAAPGDVSVSWVVDGAIVKPFWPRYAAHPSSNLGIRTELFRAIGGFDETLRASEDIDLCWRAQIAGGTFSRAGDVVVHLRKRVGLRAVYRQAFGYAEGDLRLRHKYAAYIARDRGVELPPPVDRVREYEHAREQVPVAPRRSLLGRALRVLSPEGRADAAYRLGDWMGTRRGRVAAEAEQLVPVTE
jgi:glycosyltransferase involved in cell wall biosynthesis